MEPTGREVSVGSSHSNSAAASTVASDVTDRPTGAYTLTVKANDIVLGRGAPYVHFEGNVRFREIILTRQEEYNNEKKRKRKVAIAREIFDLIASRNGRFLRKVETPEETERLGVPDGEIGWVDADEPVAMEKIKQALRHREQDKSQSSNENDALDTTLNVLASTPVASQAQAEPVFAAQTQTLLSAPPQGRGDNLSLLNGINLLSPLPNPSNSNHVTVAFWMQQQQSNDQQLSLVGQQRIELERREILLRQRQMQIQQQLQITAAQSLTHSFGSTYGFPSGMHDMITNSLNFNGLNAPLGAMASLAGSGIQRAALQVLQGQQQERQLQQILAGFASQNVASPVATAENPSVSQPAPQVAARTAPVAENQVHQASVPTSSSRSNQGNQARQKSNGRPSSSSSEDDRKRKADDESSTSSSSSSSCSSDSVKASPTKKSKKSPSKN